MRAVIAGTEAMCHTGTCGIWHIADTRGDAPQQREEYTQSDGQHRPFGLKEPRSGRFCLVVRKEGYLLLGLTVVPVAIGRSVWLLLGLAPFGDSFLFFFSVHAGQPRCCALLCFSLGSSCCSCRSLCFCVPVRGHRLGSALLDRGGLGSRLQLPMRRRLRGLSLPSKWDKWGF